MIGFILARDVKIWLESPPKRQTHITLRVQEECWSLPLVLYEKRLFGDEEMIIYALKGMKIHRKVKRKVQGRWINKDAEQRARERIHQLQVLERILMQLIRHLLGSAGLVVLILDV